MTKATQRPYYLKAVDQAAPTQRPGYLMTTDEAAALCGVSPITVRTWIRRGDLRTANKGRPRKGRIWLDVIDVARCANALGHSVAIASALAIDDEMIQGCMARLENEAPLQVQQSVVYYLRFGARIKIGTSRKLRGRLDDVPHDELLATEPGGREVERVRHRQFAALHVTKEWFRPGPELLAHITTLNESTSGHA